MLMTLSGRLVTAVAVAAVAAGAQALAWQPPAPASAAGAAGPALERAVLQDAVGTAARAAAVRYWTPARMAAALRAAGDQPTAGKPAQKRRVRRLIRKAPPTRAPGPAGNTHGKGLRWTRGGAVSAAVGKVFFTLGGTDYVCSGTLVGGRHPDVVLTAAHCVTGGPGKRGATQWATDWMFAPGFTDGLLPYGEYTARRFFVSPDWIKSGGFREQYDAAFVQVSSATLDGVADAAKPPPGLPVEFAASQEAAPPGREYVFGYPAQLPYSGLDLSYCAGPVAASGGSARTPCGMTAGDSGGPWLAGFSPRSGRGQVVAVSTYKVTSNPRVLYGAVLGPQARALYARAVRLARRSRAPARSPCRSARPPSARPGSASPRSTR